MWVHLLKSTTVSSKSTASWMKTLKYEKCKGQTVPLNETKAFKGNRNTPALKLNVSTKWRCAVSFMSRPLYSRKFPRAPWTAGRVDPKASSDILENRKFSVWIQTLDRPARRLVIILNTLCDFINSFNIEYLRYFNKHNAVMFKPQIQNNICVIVC